MLRQSIVFCSWVGCEPTWFRNVLIRNLPIELYKLSLLYYIVSIPSYSILYLAIQHFTWASYY